MQTTTTPNDALAAYREALRNTERYGGASESDIEIIYQFEQWVARTMTVGDSEDIVSVRIGESDR